MCSCGVTGGRPSGAIQRNRAVSGPLRGPGRAQGAARYGVCPSKACRSQEKAERGPEGSEGAEAAKRAHVMFPRGPWRLPASKRCCCRRTPMRGRRRGHRGGAGGHRHRQHGRAPTTRGSGPRANARWRPRRRGCAPVRGRARAGRRPRRSSGGVGSGGKAKHDSGQQAGRGKSSGKSGRQQQGKGGDGEHSRKKHATTEARMMHNKVYAHSMRRYCIDTSTRMGARPRPDRWGVPRSTTEPMQVGGVAFIIPLA